MATLGPGSDGPPVLDPKLLQEAAGQFGLLASTMRLHILWLLSYDEMDVGALAEAVGGTLQAVSQQLAKLKLAGLVRSHRDGKRQVYLIADRRLASLVRLVIEQLAAPGVADATAAERHGFGG